MSLAAQGIYCCLSLSTEEQPSQEYRWPSENYQLIRSSNWNLCFTVYSSFWFIIEHANGSKQRSWFGFWISVERRQPVCLRHFFTSCKKSGLSIRHEQAGKYIVERTLRPFRSHLYLPKKSNLIADSYGTQFYVCSICTGKLWVLYLFIVSIRNVYILQMLVLHGHYIWYDNLHNLTVAKVLPRL